jgi:hypothetical protein
MSNVIPTGHGGKRNGSGRKPKAALPDQPAADIDYHQARTRREAALAQLAEIELATRRGELIPADQVEQAWSGIISVVRTILLGLPSRIAGGVAGAATTQEISAMAMSIIREALYEIAASGESGMAKAEAMHK